jgi:type IV pilus assembly protein PilP
MSYKLLLVLVAVGALSACESSGQEEIQNWMAQQRAATRPRVQPIAEPKDFTPQAYTQEAAVDPFSSDKLTQALQRETQGSTTAVAALLAPELARTKEPLESYPLDAMTMVGSINKQGKPVALVRVDNLLYQVKPGNYLGQNYGRVTRIGESELQLRELVQDAAGEWVERIATLQLQEKSK